jgi:23S rRNA pseudouridine1911/1915/1917 synthase
VSSPEIFKVIYEDQHILVVEKKKAFNSQPSDFSGGEGLGDFIGRHLQIELFPVHRLDREVRGIMVFAKNKDSADKLSEQFKNREVSKSYLAWVRGNVQKNEDCLVHYLKKNPKNNYVTAFPRPSPGAKLAELAYKVIDRRGDHTLLEVDLKTGRTHQIRVQLSKIGHSILGDMKYGKEQNASVSGLKSLGEAIPIQLLSWRLGLTHPVLGERMTWELDSSVKNAFFP